jgi:hypothetical protein
MYNPIVTVTFKRKGFVPFVLETTLEEVFMDNPFLKPDQDLYEHELMNQGRTLVAKDIVIAVKK